MSATKTKNEQQKQTPVVKSDLVFGKENYLLLLVGIAFIILGFILMSGGGSTDPNKFSYEVFNTRRITVAPILVIIGFCIEVFAILKNPKD